MDGVSFLIAAPLENDCVVTTSDYLPVHVFYPTEQKGPVRLLLHAEFLVKSDRTAIMPSFNAWVAADSLTVSADSCDQQNRRAVVALLWLCNADFSPPRRMNLMSRKKRIEQVKALPIVPVGGCLLKEYDLSGRIVTWKPDAGVGNLPDRLPLTFVEDWFRDRIRNETEQESRSRSSRKELGIEEPGADVIQRAVGQAIDLYWKDRQGDPGRFLRFIIEQDWHETSEASEELTRCPVPLSQPMQGEAWAEAGNAYFGREWGNDLLAKLYDGVTAVQWVASYDTATVDWAKRRRVLEWLGVAHCPRILDEDQRSFVRQLPEGCGQWKQYLDTARDRFDRHVERIATVSQMDHLTIYNLDVARGVLLIDLVAQHWESYYRNRGEVTADGKSIREQNYRHWQVKSKWWWEICERLPLPRIDGCAEYFPLTALWLLKNEQSGP